MHRLDEQCPGVLEVGDHDHRDEGRDELKPAAVDPQRTVSFHRGLAIMQLLIIPYRSHAPPGETPRAARIGGTTAVSSATVSGCPRTLPSLSHPRLLRGLVPLAA